MFYIGCMKVTTFVALLLLSAQSVADNLKLSLQQIESEWALNYYQALEAGKGDAYLRLLDKTVKLAKQHPNQAELLFWQALLKASYAKHQDAIGALEAIKEARNLLHEAIQIDPKTMDGSAYVTLGTLYYMVPKWPIAFGDDVKAKEMLEAALKINPDGIDTNYFFGEFLLSKGKTSEAIIYFEKAAKAPARKEQLYADNQMKTEANIALRQAMKQQQTKNRNVFLSLFNSSIVE